MAENLVGNEQEVNKQAASVKRHDGVITVVLTADNHLGQAVFRQQPRKREELQQRLRQAFQQATDFAIMQGVDLFIQAGDLFDTALPNEHDRSLVAARLAQLKQAGVRTFALGGVHDTPRESHLGTSTLAPQSSYARLGALHYFSAVSQHEAQALVPVIVTIEDIRVGICGLGVLAGQEGDPLATVRVQEDMKHIPITLLILHAPIEGLATGSSLLDTRAQVSRSSIENQNIFRYILAGYHHGYSCMHLGHTDVIVAGATQHVDMSAPDQAPGFVFLGLAADGIRWCNHISIEGLGRQRIVIQSEELFLEGAQAATASPTERMLERLGPLCHADVMIQLRLEGTLTRRQYHQLDLNQIRRYGEEHCFALSIDDSALSFLSESEQEAISMETGERLSPREELVALVDEWIAVTSNEQEKRGLNFTKEDLLSTMDEINGKQ